MDVQLTVAEARQRWAEVLDRVQDGSHVTITRRGQPVALVLSAQEYDLLMHGRTDVWVAIEGFRDRHGPDLVEDGWAEDLRSDGAGRPFDLGG